MFNAYKELNDLIRNTISFTQKNSKIFSEATSFMKDFNEQLEDAKNITEKMNIAISLNKKMISELGDLKLKEFNLSTDIEKSINKTINLNQLLKSQQDLITERKIAQNQMDYKKINALNNIIDSYTKLIKLNEQIKNGDKDAIVEMKNILKNIEDRIKNYDDEKKWLEKRNTLLKNELKKYNEQLTYLERLVKATGKFGDTLKNVYSKMIEIFKDARINLDALSLVLIESTYKVIENLGDVTQKVRETTGVLVSQSRMMENNINQITSFYSNIGADAEKVAQNNTEIIETFGVIAAEQKEILGDVTLISQQYGIQAKDSSKVLQTFMGLSNYSKETAMSMSVQVIQLAKAAQVAPKKVMEDIANASGETLSILRGNVKQLALAAVEARRLGTNINEVSKSMRSMLNFQESIKNEMELSALLGTHINLQGLRQLSWQGKGNEFLKERNKITMDILKNNNLNAFQLDSLGKAMNMTTEELMKQKAQAELLNQVSKENPKLAEQYTKQLNKINEYQESSTLSAADRLKIQMMEMEMQSELNKIMTQFSAMWYNIGQILYPIALLILPIISGLILGISDFVTVIGQIMSWLGKQMSYIDSLVSSLFGNTIGIYGIIQGLFRIIVSVFVVIGSIYFFFPGLFKIIQSMFTWVIDKILGVLPKAITNLGNLISKLFLYINKGIYGIVSTVIKSSGLITSTIIKTFTSITNTLSKATSNLFKIGFKLGTAIGSGIRIFFTQLSKVSWIDVGKFVAISAGLSIALIGLSYAIKYMYNTFKQVDIKTLGYSLVTLGVVLLTGFSLMTVAGNVGLVAAGIFGVVVAVLVTSIIGLSVASKVANLAMQDMTLAMKKIIGVINNMVVDMGKISMFIAVITMIASSLAMVGILSPFIYAGSLALSVASNTIKYFGDSLSSINFSSINEIFNSILKLGEQSSSLMLAGTALSMIALSMSALVATKMGSWFSGDPFSNLYRLASYSGELMTVANALTFISNTGDNAYNTIMKISEAVDNLAESLNNISTLKLATLSATLLSGGVSNILNGINTKQNDVVAKLDELINLMKDGKIGVYLDGEKINNNTINKYAAAK